MQGLIEKRAENNEKQKAWREKNLEKSKFIKYNSTRKSRGHEPITFEEYLQRPVFVPRAKKEITDKVWSYKESPIEVEQCTTCYRKYLTKLYCLWCNDYIYGRRN